MSVFGRNGFVLTVGAWLDELVVECVMKIVGSVVVMIFGVIVVLAFLPTKRRRRLAFKSIKQPVVNKNL